jgi:hypothetical protein
MPRRLAVFFADFASHKGGTAVAVSSSDVATASVVRHSLLDNADVSSYLHDLDSVEDFESERSQHVTSTPQFRADVAALGEGMLDDEPPDEHGSSAVPGTLDDVVPEPGDAFDDFGASTTDPARVTGVATALFLVGMSLLGASSAAIVFHERVLLLLGW